MVTIVDYGTERVKALSNIVQTNFCIINKKNWYVSEPNILFWIFTRPRNSNGQDSETYTASGFYPMQLKYLMSQCSGQGLYSLENTELIDFNFLVELRCQIFFTASDESKK